MMTSIDGDVLLEELTVGTRPSVSELEVGGGNSSTPLRSGSGAASSLPSTPVAFTKEFARTATATTPTAAYSPFNPASMALSLDAYGAAPATVAMHGFSNPVLAAPMLQSQLMQMQNQMAMLSQAMAMGSPNVARQPAQQDPMLCFSLGERLGALHKNEEMTKDDIKEMQQLIHDTSSGVSELRARQCVLEANLDFIRAANAQIQHQQEKLLLNATDTAASLVALDKDRQHDHELIERFQQASEKAVKTLSNQVHGAVAATAEQTAQLRALANDVKHQEHEQKQQKKHAEQARSELTSLASRLQATQLNVQRDREERERTMQSLMEQLNRLVQEQADAIGKLETKCARDIEHTNTQHERALSTLQRELRDTLQQHQLHMAQMQQQQQHQLLLLSQQSNSAAFSIGSGMLSLLLQSLLPFLPYDRVQSIVGWLGSLCFSLQTSPHMRTVWTMLLAGDVSLRLLDRFCPVVSSVIYALCGARAISPVTRFALNLLRLALEVGFVVQICFAVAEWTRTKYQNARESVNQKVSSARDVLKTAALLVLCIAAPTALIVATWRYHSAIVQYWPTLLKALSVVSPVSLLQSSVASLSTEAIGNKMNAIRQSISNVFSARAVAATPPPSPIRTPPSPSPIQLQSSLTARALFD